MPAFGSTINPSLGRVDYTPYLQGAAQGAAQIGQGIQQLGAGIGAAVKEYQMNKEKKALEESAAQAIKSFAIQNPEEAKSVGITDPTDSGMVKHLVKSFGGAAPTLQAINSLTQMKQQKEAFGMEQEKFGEYQKAKAIQDAAMTIRQGRALPTETDPAIANAAYVMARQGKMAEDQAAASLAKTQAETVAISSGKPQKQSYKTAEEANAVALKMAAGNKDLVATSEFDPATGGFIPTTKVLPAKQIQDPIAAYTVKGLTSTLDKARASIDAGKSAKEQMVFLNDPNLVTGLMAKPAEIAFQLGGIFDEKSSERAALQSIASKGLTKDTIASFKTFMGGLGALSDMEGKRVEKALPSITDPITSIKFANAMTQIAGERAKLIEDTFNQMDAEGASVRDINIAVNKIKDDYNATDEALRRIGKQQQSKSSNTLRDFSGESTESLQQKLAKLQSL